MVAKVIKNLLVGIGYDVDRQSFDAAEGSIDAIGKKALQVGGILAGAFGAKALTADFAKSYDSLGKFSEVMGVLPGDVDAFGAALEAEGGSLQGFMSQLEDIISKRDRLRTGDYGWFEDAILAGFNPEALTSAANGIEAYLAIADQMQSMDATGRRLVADALGLDDASVRLLSRGSEGVSALVQEMRDAKPVTLEMTQAAADFNYQLQMVQRNIKGIADVISAEGLPELSRFMENVNSLFSDNRDDIKGAAKTTASVAGGHVARVYSAPGNLMDLGSSILNWDFDKLTGKGPADFLPQLMPVQGAYNYLSDYFSAPPPQQSNALRGTVDRSGGYQGPETLRVDVHYDGALIEKKVIDIQQREASRAIEDLTSSAD